MTAAKPRSVKFKALRIPFLPEILRKKNLKEEFTSSVLEKRSQTHKRRLKRTLFNWTKQDKTCTFSRKSSFSKLHTIEKQKNKLSIHLAYVSLILDGWQKEKGTRLIKRPSIMSITDLLYNNG